MTHTIDILRQALAGKGAILGALFSSSLGVGAETLAGASGSVSTVVIVALCGAAGAFFGCLPRMITAMSGADATARKLLGAELKTLLRRIDMMDQRIMLEQDGKHTMQSEHNLLAVHIQKLEALLQTASVAVPAFHIKTYEEMLGPNNRAIKALMLADIDDEEAAE